jgi:prepilin-type N-terminal cleavage/methylation domain-containing protein
VKPKYILIRGFTLVEMAVVLVIVGLMLGGLLLPLSAQMDQQHFSETRKGLDDIQEALIGYAMVNGRLPCPATATSNGLESPPTASTGVACDNPYNGFVPAVTLGLNHVDSSGYAVDGWGNRIHYAVTQADSLAYTTQNGMKTHGMTSTWNPNLYVCNTSTGITATTCGTATSLTINSPAVIYSIGKNGASGGNGNDEKANPNPNSINNDRVFVYHEPTSASATNGEFDDQMIWLSNVVLLNRMVVAGQLP